MYNADEALEIIMASDESNATLKDIVDSASSSVDTLSRIFFP